MCARCSKTNDFAYFVVMVDYGGRIGIGANVEAEMTRTAIVAELKSEKPFNGRVLFIHHIEDGLVEDITQELMDEAEGELKVEAINRSERVAYQHDHERKLRVAS